MTGPGKSQRIPRLEVIEAFIEAARAPSFRIAAERCGLSPAAFSRRIQAFRHFAGREVFDRTPAGVRLNDAGRECLALLEPSYRAMVEAARELGASARTGKVTISLSHSLAVAWLIPRIERFRARFPQIEVALVSTRSAEEVRSGGVDLGICASDVDVAGLHAERLLDVDVTPVASPALAEEIRSGRRRLRDCRLFAPKHEPEIWRWWAGHAGADFDDLPRAEVFDMAYTLYEAAALGWGVAAGMSATVSRHLASGQVVALGLPVVRHPGCYQLVAKSSRMRSAPVAAFWSWIVDQAREPPAAYAFQAQRVAEAPRAAIRASAIL